MLTVAPEIQYVVKGCGDLIPDFQTQGAEISSQL
jgi:hypothetical protein